MARTWIFPYFDSDLGDRKTISPILSWLILERDDSEKMELGDLVYLFSFARSDEGMGGIFASAVIVEKPAEWPYKWEGFEYVLTTNNPPFWAKNSKDIFNYKEFTKRKREQRLRVGLRLEKVATKKSIIENSLIENDPILHGLKASIHTTHYLVPENQEARLKELWVNAGENSKTAVIADSIFGDKPYQKHARAALPMLIRQAETGKPITYFELAKELKMPNARNLNYVLGSVGKSLEMLSVKWAEPIPPIQSLVINKNTLLPGPGFDNFLISENFSKLSPGEKAIEIDKQHQRIYLYLKWKEVLKELSLLPAIKNIFERGATYSRKDVYKILGLPINTKGGNWDTGCNKFNGDWFIFCNLGTPGRTGHDYGNRFDGEDLIWYGKTGSKFSHSTIQDMLKPKGKIYVFCRSDNNAPFTYAGAARAIEIKKQTPVKIIWKFDDPSEPHPERLPEEEGGGLEEGGVKKISVNAYERNPQARAECLRHYGYKCSVCKFDFNEEYGEIGKNFIHVHHLKLISGKGKKYIVDPIKDLRPVCPNCHAMLHSKKDPYTIGELENIIHKIRDLR